MPNLEKTIKEIERLEFKLNKSPASTAVLAMQVELAKITVLLHIQNELGQIGSALSNMVTNGLPIEDVYRK